MVETDGRTTTREPDFDADLEHEWARRWRIPLVTHWHPRWRYEVALVVPSAEPYVHPPTVWPSEQEAAIVASTIDYRMTYYNAGWAAKMRERALDVDGSTNTLILGKTEQGWRYRLASHVHGPLVWPAYDTPPEIAASYTPDTAGLVALLDRWKTIVDHVYEPWLAWKAEHPLVFG